MKASARCLLVSLSPLLDEIWEHINRELRDDNRDEEFLNRLKQVRVLFDPSNRDVVSQLIFFTLKSRLLKSRNGERVELLEDKTPSPGELFRNILRDRTDLTPEQAWQEVDQILERGAANAGRVGAQADQPSQAERDGPIPMDTNNDNKPPSVADRFNVNATEPSEATQIPTTAFFRFGR
jgi:hypothetical protein